MSASSPSISDLHVVSVLAEMDVTYSLTSSIDCI